MEVGVSKSGVGICRFREANIDFIFQIFEFNYLYKNMVSFKIIKKIILIQIDFVFSWLCTQLNILG